MVPVPLSWRETLRVARLVITQREAGVEERAAHRIVAQSVGLSVRQVRCACVSAAFRGVR